MKESGLNDRDLLQARRDAGIAQAQLDALQPYFKILKENIHAKWEALNLDDGGSAKLLKFQLLTVVNLEKAMVKKVKEGKLADHKMEAIK